MDNNYLFLTMQTGGQLSPEQLQRAQQMGQLPQMNMGAGLNDIQKMNMAEAQHYNMFKRGGAARMYAERGEQEEVDQQYLSPYTQYNQRVSDFLQNLRATSMNALQDEMIGVNDEYAEEADQIEMEQAQYGRQVSQPTLNPQGMAAVNAWMGAAQNTKDLTKPLAQTAGLASGLKGYFGGDQASYEANPYNAAWNPTRLTMTNKDTGEETVSRARRNGFFQPGGQTSWEQQLFQGTPIAPQQAQPQRGTGEMLRAIPPQAGQYDAQTIANARAMGWGDDVAGYTNSKFGYGPQAAANLPTSTKKKPAATAPTPAATTTVPATTTTAAATEEEKKKAEADAKAKEEAKTTATTTETKKNTGEVDYLAMLADPTGQNAGGVYRTDKNGNPVPMAFYDPNMRLKTVTPTYRNNVASWLRGDKKHGQLKSVAYDFTTGAQSPATQVPSITEGPKPNMPTVANNVTTPTSNQSAPTSQAVPNQTSRFFPQVPQPTTTYPGGPFPAGNANDNAWIDDQWKQAAANWKPGMTYNGPQEFLPTSIRGNQATASGPLQIAQNAPLTDRQKKQLERAANIKEKYDTRVNKIKAQNGLEVLPANQGYDMGWAPIGQEKRAPEDRVNPNVQMSQEFNKQKYGEPITINTPESNYTATYDKNKKDNPFFAPAMLAGLNVMAGAAQNMDAKQKENQLRNKLSYDQIYTANPETSGNRGDWTANEGYFRPNDMVPTQFTGAGMQMQWGGAYSEGDELYLDEDAIQAFLQAGGQLDYLD